MEFFLTFNKGIVFVKMAQFSKAVECFKRLIEINPIMQESYLWLAEIEFNKGGYKEALDYCDRAIEALTDKNRISRPDIAFCLKAHYMIKNDEYEAAVQVLNQLRHLINYDDPYALLLLANISYNKSCLLRDNAFEQSKNQNLIFKRGKSRM